MVVLQIPMEFKTPIIISALLPKFQAMDSLFSKPIHYYSPILFYLCTTLLFPTDGEKVLVQKVEGDVKIIPALIKTIPGPAIAGKTLSSGDLIKTGPSGRAELLISHNQMKVKMHPNSELMYMGNKDCYLKTSKGLLFVIKDEDTSEGCKIQTSRSELEIFTGELLLSTGDEERFFSLKGDISVTIIEGKNRVTLSAGEMTQISNNHLKEKSQFESADIPEEYYNRYIQNQLEENTSPVFTLLTPLSPEFAKERENTTDTPKRFFVNIDGGFTLLGDYQYSHAALKPAYFGESVYLAYNLAGFIGISDSAENINRFSSLSRILAPLDLRVNTPRISIRAGRIDKLTFGHGILLKNYTNTVSYPLLQDGGIQMDYTSYTERFSTQFFISGIEELTTGGGIIGLYSSGLINPLIPLRLGIGVVSDFNQLGTLPDTTWGERKAPTASSTGFQAGFTYHLGGDLRKDTYLFGELSIHTFGQSLRYIKSVASAGDTTEQGFERSLSYGFTAPGIWWKLGHFSQAKLAFTFASALHQLPYFNESYSLERLHYVPASEVTAIESAEPYGEDDKWTSMVKSYYSGNDSSAYYLPKDIKNLLDPTYNAYDKIGLLVVYQHTFRTYYEYSLEFMYLTETGTTAKANNYYSLGIEAAIHEGLIHGISELGLYYKHQFSPVFFSTSNAENVLYGFNVGIKLLKRLTFIIQSRTVFFDKNLDGKTDKITTQGINLKFAF